MASSLGEFERYFLWADCDQCGTAVEIQYAKTGDGYGMPTTERARNLRKAWVDAHAMCSVSRSVRVTREEFEESVEDAPYLEYL